MAKVGDCHASLAMTNDKKEGFTIQAFEFQLSFGFYDLTFSQ
jgi:hypothetical protein